MKHALRRSWDPGEDGLGSALSVSRYQILIYRNCWLARQRVLPLFGHETLLAVGFRPVHLVSIYTHKRR